MEQCEKELRRFGAQRNTSSRLNQDRLRLDSRQMSAIRTNMKIVESQRKKRSQRPPRTGESRQSWSTNEAVQPDYSYRSKQSARQRLQVQEGQPSQALMLYLKRKGLDDLFLPNSPENGIINFTYNGPREEQTEILRYLQNAQLDMQSYEFEDRENCRDWQENKALLEILQAAQDVISFRFKDKELCCVGYDTIRLKSVLQEIQILVEAESLQIFKYEVLQKQKVKILRTLQASKTKLYQECFKEIKISNLFKDPATRKWKMAFVSSAGCRVRTELDITERIDRLWEERIRVSKYVAQLLYTQDSQFPQFTFLQKQEALHKCVVLLEKENSLIESNRGRRKEDRYERKEEEEQIELKLRIEDPSCQGYTLRIISFEIGRTKAVLKAVFEKIERLEQNKKFFKISNESKSTNETSPQRSQLPSIDNLDTISLRSLDFSTAEFDWPRIVARLGLGHFKTDFSVAFERHYHVLLYTQQTQRFRGIMMYGNASNKRLAFIELGSLFNMHTLQRCALPLQSSLYSLLVPHLPQFLLKLRAQFKRAQVFLSPSVLHPQIVAFTDPERIQALQTRITQFLEQVKASICMELIPPELTILKHAFTTLRLKDRIRAQISQNSTQEEQIIVAPKYVKKAFWSYEEEGIFKRYEDTMSSEIEKYYNAGQQFFLLGSSNFAIIKGRENDWREQTDEYRFAVKRELILQPSHKVKRAILPGAYVIKGQLNEIKYFLKVTRNQFNQRYKDPLIISSQANEEIALKAIQEQYSVIFTKQKTKNQDSKEQYRVYGTYKEEAGRKYHDIKKAQESILSKEIPYYLDRASSQFQEIAFRILKGVSSRLFVKITSIEKIEDQIANKRYNQQRKLLEPTRQVDLLYTVGTANKSSKLHKFSTSAAFWIQKQNSEMKLLICYILLGKLHKADASEANKPWIIPPRFYKLKYALRGQKQHQSFSHERPFSHQQVERQYIEQESSYIEVPLNSGKPVATQYYNSVFIEQSETPHHKATSFLASSPMRKTHIPNPYSTIKSEKTTQKERMKQSEYSTPARVASSLKRNQSRGRLIFGGGQEPSRRGGGLYFVFDRRQVLVKYEVTLEIK